MNEVLGFWLFLQNEQAGRPATAVIEGNQHRDLKRLVHNQTGTAMEETEDRVVRADP